MLFKNNKILKIFLRLSIGIISTMVLLLALLYALVHYYSPTLIQKIKSEYAQHYIGQLEIKHIKANFWHQFPIVSFELDTVRIKDKHWAQHHKNLFTANKVFVQLKLFPLVRGKFKVRKVSCEQGLLHIIQIDSVLNNYDLSKNNHQENTKDIFQSLPIISLKDFKIHFENHYRQKQIELYFNKLLLSHKNYDQYIDFKLKSHLKVEALVFNPLKGSYLKGKTLFFKGHIAYSPAQKMFYFNRQKIHLDHKSFLSNGSFQFKQQTPVFTLDFMLQQYNFNEIKSYLTAKSQYSLRKLQIEQAIPLQIHIKGYLKHKSIPKIDIQGRFNKNILSVPWAQIKQLNGKFSYQNSSHSNPFIGDSNAYIRLYNLQFRYYDLPFNIDSGIIYRLKFPLLKCHITSSFPIQGLNKILAQKSIHFTKGTINLDLNYFGQIAQNAQDSSSQVNGYVNLSQVALEYLPRNIQLHDCNVKMRFNHQNIYFENGSLHSPNNHLRFNAQIENFFKYYRKAADSILLQGTIFSKHLDLNDFRSFTTKRNTIQNKNNALETNTDTSLALIDNILNQSKSELQLNFEAIKFNKLNAQNIKARLSLLPKAVLVPNAQFQIANGTVQLQGSINETEDKSTTFKSNMTIEHVQLDSIFYYFDNFGQYSLKAKNIRGFVDLQSSLNGALDTLGKLEQKLLLGHLHIHLYNGQLLSFKPLIRIGKLLMRRKAFEQVLLEPLHLDMNIKGTAVKFEPTKIKSNIVNMQFDGTYHFDSGTHFNIEIPLFQQALKQGKDKEGYWMYIQAQETSNGLMQYNWKIRNNEIERLRKSHKLKKQ